MRFRNWSEEVISYVPFNTTEAAAVLPRSSIILVVVVVIMVVMVTTRAEVLEADLQEKIRNA